MKRIAIEQGTKEWLAWRKTLVTATDCPAILGSSPWVSHYKCWQKKLGLVEEKKSTKAMDDGLKYEPIARELFIKETAIHVEPACVESSEFSFLGASLDGMTSNGKILLEIKCGGEELHNQAAHGIIPDYYMHQIQCQLLVTRAEICYYQSYNYRDGTSHIIKVYPDPEFEKLFVPAYQEFWRRVVYFEPPPMTQKDYQNMNDSIPWKECTEKYIEVDAQIKALEEKKDYLRKEMIRMCDGQSSQGAGLKVMSIIMKGRVDTEKMAEVEKIDLDKYRKESTTSWKFFVEK